MTNHNEDSPKGDHELAVNLTDETTNEIYSFSSDGFDRFIESLIQDIQDEQENSVDDLPETT